MLAEENFLENKEKIASYKGTVNSFILTYFGSQMIMSKDVYEYVVLTITS